MNLDFSYPSNFTNTGRDDTITILSNFKWPRKLNDCTAMPVRAMDMREAPPDMIILRRWDGVCTGSMGTEINAERGRIAMQWLNDSFLALGKPDLSKGTDYEISGHPAYTVSGTLKLNDVKGTVLYESVSCIAVGKDLACFEFFSSDCQTLASLVASKVKFKEAAAAPVIPDNLAIACKPGA